MHGQSIRPRRGMFLADISIGLAVVGTLAVVMFGLLVREQAVARRMASSRAATRAAESALADLQAGRAVQTQPSATDPSAPPVVSVRRAEGGAAVPGHAWVGVRATAGDKSVELVGLVPDGPELRRQEERERNGPAGATRPTTGEAP